MPLTQYFNDQNQYSSFIILFLPNNCLLCSIYWHSFELENRLTDFHEQHDNFDESMIYYILFDLECFSAWTKTFVNRHESDKIGVYNILWFGLPTDIEFIKKKRIWLLKRENVLSNKLFNGCMYLDETSSTHACIRINKVNHI